MRKHCDVKLRSGSTHLNYVQNENKNTRTISVGGTMPILIGFVIAVSNTKNGASLNEKNLFSVYNTREGRNNKSFGTVQY